MKKLAVLFAIGLFALVVACTNSSSAGNNDGVVTKGARIDFKNTEHNFGKIPYQGNAEYNFVFENTGSEPLVLQHVKSTCGCTVPEWPKEPIAPGEKASIKVRYNTRITGSFSKGIVVYSNAEDATIQLRIKGEVEKPAAGSI
jgi:hypothetical protein